MRESKNNKPAIRFQGYTDTWKQCKLGDLGNFKNGMNFSKDAMDKGYPFVNLQNIFGKNVIDTDHLGLAEASDSQLKEYNLLKGDVLFVRSSVKLEGVGEAAMITQDLIDTTYSGFVIRFRDETDMDENFKRYIFGTKPIRDQIMAKATNSANKNISQEALSNVVLCIPSKEEQTTIGDYFIHFDEVIAKNQRKYDHLMRMRQTLLRKMFPHGQQKVPEIRFKSFSDHWKQRELGEVIKEFYNGQTPYRLNKEYWNGSINWLTSGDLNRGIITHTMEKITEKGRHSAGLRILPKGTMIIAIMGLEANGTRGNCGILGIESTINQACMALITDENILSTEYLFQWYQCFGEHYAMRITQGTKQQNYNSEILGRLSISYPSIAEQRAIVKFLSSIDSLIALHSQRIEILKNIKRFMMEKMFV